jgi:hypothetical protein
MTEKPTNVGFSVIHSPFKTQTNDTRPSANPTRWHKRWRLYLGIRFYKNLKLNGKMKDAEWEQISEQQQPVKIRKIEFAPPLSIPIPEKMQTLLKSKSDNIKAANIKMVEAQHLELQAQKMKQEAHTAIQKATIEGQAIVEVVLNEHDMLGKPHTLPPELDIIVVDPN